MHPINFVFDIDDTLAVHFDNKERLKLLTEQIAEAYGNDFLEKNIITALGYPHFIFPGIPALLKYVHNLGHNIFIFSSAVKERNEELVDKLISLVWGNGTTAVRPKIKVFSRNDCLDTYYLEKQDDYQPIFFGNLKKVLTDVVVPKEEMPWTLLIDDDASYMAKNEEYNFVKVECSSFFDILEYDRFYKYAAFFKAFYLAGLFEAIFKRIEQKNCTAVNAAKYLQIDSSKIDFNSKFYYLFTLRNMEYYKAGIKILSAIDPKATIFDSILDRMIMLNQKEKR